MNGCLSDDDVLAFAIGRLPTSRLAAAHLHFDECEVCQQLLSEAAHALAMAATIPLAESADSSWNTTFRPGTLVGQRYLIRRFIVRGGMGEVYEAFDQDLQQRIALKTVTSTACDNPSAVRLLKAEVQLARRVSHPNVCRIYDFGMHTMPSTKTQISFLTMEFVEGETLGQRIRLSGALPVAEARKIGRQLLLGLSAAHDAHVMHHDFKSDNVMLRYEEGDASSPVILDFGLARALDPDAKQRSSASHGTLRGTFGYMAPEQLENKPYSKASDVYAFGIVWYEMLTGELPFESSSSPALAILERVQRAAPAPSNINPLVPRDLDLVVRGCLRRSPKDRYRTAGEVLEALDKLESQANATGARRKSFLRSAGVGLAGFALYLALGNRPQMAARATLTSSLSRALAASSTAEPALADADNQQQPRAEARAAASATADPRPPPAPPRKKRPSEALRAVPAASASSDAPPLFEPFPYANGRTAAPRSSTQPHELEALPARR